MEMLQREGIDLSAGQQTGHVGLQNIEGDLAGAELVRLSNKQMEQFTQAVLKRIGIGANRATKDVLSAGNERLGAAFGDIGSRNDIQLADGKLGNDLRKSYYGYAKSTAEANRLPAIEDFIVEATMAMKPKGGVDVLDGNVYASLRTRVGQLARETADPKQNSVLMDIQRALDDAMERSLSKGDVDAFRWARAADRDFTIIQKAALQDPSGLISPTALQSAAVAGQGDLAKLADSGTMLMTPPSPAGLAPGTRQLLSAGPTIAGSYIGNQIGDVNGAAVGAALAGAAGPYAAGSAILSNPGRRYLANQVLNGPPSGSNGFGPLGAMLAGQTGEISPSRDPLAELGEIVAIGQSAIGGKNWGGL